MLQGHEADSYSNRAILTGIFNRLGDGKGSPLKCEPPAWMTQRKVNASREEIALARDAFKQFVGQRGG